MTRVVRWGLPWVVGCVAVAQLGGQAREATGVSEGEGLNGAKVFADRQCDLCHGFRDTGDGPTLRELWGTEVELRDGSTVIADEAYVRESIVEPDAKVVKGYDAGKMKGYVEDLSDAEVEALVRLIERIGPKAD